MNYTQQNRAMEVTTPVGTDKLLLIGFTGQESLSRLFNFHLDLIAENETDIAFDKLLGQKITVRLDLLNREKRYFSGICNRVSQGERDEVFTHYRMEVVPELWKLTKKAQSRIFQQMTVPDILKKVLAGLDVTYEIQGTFHPRDFCVQYRETDFNFISRLMEQEGIYYFFEHEDEGKKHKLKLVDAMSAHSEYPDYGSIKYRAGADADVRGNILSWCRLKQLQPGAYKVNDFDFKRPKTPLLGGGTKDRNHANSTFEMYDFAAN